MKRLKHNLKKGMAFVLSLVMVAGFVPAMSGGVHTVQAATNPGTEPSVTAFATKDQLMGDTFKPDSNGNATTKGKLVFGKKSDGTTAQEWYILGADSGVTGGTNNTIIFAASPIATNKVFNSSTGNNANTSSWSDCNYGGGSVTEVYANHYGASKLRDTLQTIAADTSYFTTAEQGLMNPTTVTTNDTKNSTTYTTTDKLYALAADGYGSTSIKAGSDNSTVLDMNSYWSSGAWFRLRSPRGSIGESALLAKLGLSVGFSDVSLGFAVRPASNLKLSSVLFASAATAASSDTESGTITDGTAMTLRLDGTGKDIGTVEYSATTGDIRAVKGSTSQTVALIVQGRGTVGGEEKDWYYSKKIDASETINVSDIVSESNTPELIDLSTCKIWLETTDSTEHLTYAVEATVAAPTITTQPSDAEIDNGETATFAIVASGVNLTYQWQINKNDGNGWKEISGANAASYTTSTVDANCDGYQYKCVVSNSGGDVESNTVKLNIKKYTVSFDTKGGAETIASQAVVKGGKVSEPTTPTKTGYVFDGWYSSDTYSADSKWNFTSNTVSANTTIYAKWLSTDAGVTKVSVNGKAGTIDGTDITVVLPYGSTIPTDASAVSVTPVAGACVSVVPSTSDNGSTWTFTVKAEDGTTTKNYTVNVSVSTNPGGGGSSSSSTGGGSSSSDNPGSSSSESSETDDPVTVTVPEKGTLLTDSETKMVYRVTKSAKIGGTVQFVRIDNSKAKTITIPATVTFDGITYKVTSIAAGALKNNKVITKVVIGKNVTEIGKGAFSGCTKLKSVTIGKSVTTIGSKAFYNCTSLTTLTIPASVTKIQDYAFKGCSKLSTLKIKSTKLTNKTLAELSMKGISTKTVIKVPKSKLKAYKTLFVKKGLSKKVTMKSL